MNINEVRVLIAFNIFSDKHLVADLNDKLGLKPNSSIDKDSIINAKNLVAKRTRWSIEELGYDLDKAEDILGQLLIRLKGMSNKLNLLSDEVEYQLSICLSWYSGDPSPGIRLSTEELKFLSKNNIALEINTEMYPSKNK